MIELKVNFSQLQSRIDAARSLQDAGMDDDCKSCLIKIANDIKEKIIEKTSN